jgi:methionine-rich copper-binding protein CopC
VRNKGLIIPINNYAALVNGTAPQAVFGTPMELNLGGRGIRSIDKGTDGNYLIIAGPAAGASSDADRNFALYSWNGNPTSNPIELDNNLETLRKATGGSFESIVDVPGAVVAGTAVQLLMDNGDTVFPGETSIAKDLDAPKQKFQGFRIKLGNAYLDNVGPVLKSSTPTDDRIGVNVDTQFVLTFNEGVKLGEGNITLRKADGTAIENFNASTSTARVQVKFNVITIKPTANLENSAGYYLTIDANAISDHKGNAYAGISGSTAFNFTAAGTPTPLAVGDMLFMAANAEAPDAFSFVLLKAVNGGTRITFTDRNRKADPLEFSGITNEGVFVWTADRNLAAGTIVTIQTDTPASPIADKGFVVGSPAGLGKEETIYALNGATITGLGDGTAGVITAVGDYLASITLGGAAGTIPAVLTTAGTAISFIPDVAIQTNAQYAGSLVRTNLTQFAALVKDPKNWKTSAKPALGYPLTDGSLFPGN